jgi:hypothetical protein
MDGQLESSLSYARPKTSKMRAKQTEHAALSARDQSNQFRALMSVLRKEHILVLTARGELLMHKTCLLYGGRRDYV